MTKAFFQIRIFFILSSFFIVGLFFPFFSFSAEYNVSIINSPQIKPYNTAITGFKQELNNQEYDINYSYFNLSELQHDEQSREVFQTQPTDMILAVGTEAALIAKELTEETPILFSMVLDPVESGIVDTSDSSRESNLTGVFLKIEIKEQFEKMKELMPNLQKIGMLYDAEKKKGLKAEAESAAERLGLQLIAEPVFSKKEVMSKLEHVLNESDFLWAGVDTLIYNSQSAQHILLATLRNKIPFMAFSSHYVTAGALIALECDYEDIGRQSAEMAIKILNGRTPGRIPAEKPRKLHVITNQNTAQVIGMKIPQSLVED